MDTNGTILIIDDESDARALFAKFLERKGYKVLEAPSVLEGLRILKQENVDLVLTDYSMPFMTGLDFLRECRAMFPQIPVIMMSGTADMQTAVTALRDHAFDFLSKPVDSNELLKAVKGALGRSQEAAVSANSIHAGKGIGPIYCTRSTVDPTVTVLEFNRPLDEYSQKAFDSSLQRLIADGEIQRSVVFLLRNVPYINNVGMNFLVSLHDEWKRKGHRIVLAQLSDPVYKYLKMLGYLDYFANAFTTQDAIAQLT